MRWRLIVIVVFCAALFSGQVLAAPLVVIGDGTPGSCTEAAFQTALNTVDVDGTIEFNCGGSPHTIVFTTTKRLLQNVTIDGGSRDLITLSGGNTVTVLEVDRFVPLVTLKNLTIANGRGVDKGGGVRGLYRASLTIENCLFINNVAVSAVVNIDNGGGAVYMHSGELNVTNTIFQNNRSENSSGGAMNLLHSNITITDSLFDSNEAGYFGGGFYNDGMIGDDLRDGREGWVRSIRNTFINNTAMGQGGAVFNNMYINRQRNILSTFESNRFINNRVNNNFKNHAYGGALRVENGPVEIVNSVFSGNVAEREGGALWTGKAASATVANTTFYNNTALGMTSADGFGGAIKIASSGVFTIANVTIANNYAGYNGGALWGGGSNVTLYNTIIAFNDAGNTWGENLSCNRTYRNGGGNIQTAKLTPQDRSCVSGILHADPLLGPLADNGGLTQTMALLPGSPAIDLGSDTCPDTDQRGVLRHFDGNYDGLGRCDSGAYEYDVVSTTSAPNAAPPRNFFDTLTPMLSWGFVSWATGYAIEIDNNPYFTSVNYRDETIPGYELSAIVGPLLNNMTWYWRVRAKRADGTWGAWSATDSFHIQSP
jgi:hypothetical protein